MGVTYEDLSSFIACCIGRSDDYALQLPDGSYRRQGMPISYESIYQHFAGKQTIATYVINEMNTATFAVFDHDSDDPSYGLSVLLRIQLNLKFAGISAFLERSRRGGHLWVFCMPTHPSILRAWLLPYCPDDPELEFYPKQDTLSEVCPYGSAIRVPLGIHRLTGLCYPFVYGAGDTLLNLFDGWSEVFAFFARVYQNRNVPPSTDPSVRQEPTLPPQGKSPSNSSPTSIAEWCLQYDPLEVIGRYVELDRNGNGCCPFGGHHSDGVDAHPSLHVYYPTVSNIMCWYCRTWRKGGSLFDFLKMYHGMTARGLWMALQQGVGF